MIENLEQTFRWFGPADEVTLPAIRQTGATGIVNALHHIPTGEIWGRDEIKKRHNLVKEAGFSWSVVESVNIHESIKTGAPGRDQYIENYIKTLKNLSAEGIGIVCYNFMPVLDWTRTNLDFRLSNGASALRYHAPAVAAFDLYILERPGAFDDFTPSQQQKAKEFLDQLSKHDRETLINTVMAGLPGTDEVFTIAEFREHLEKYSETDAPALKRNLAYFLRAIIPYAEKFGIKMCIHPDDPPFPILGLPRVVSNEQDIRYIYDAVNSPNNGLTFCTGSFGVNADNDLPGMIQRLGDRIHFIHLRSTKRDEHGNFFEADHLAGDVDMYAVMKALLEEQQKRINAERKDINMPFRPDHGHKMLDDLHKKTNPGYSAIGRLRGLAELRGLELGIKKAFNY